MAEQAKKFDKEAEAIYSEMWKIKTQLINLNNEIRIKENELKNIDMKCYAEKNNTCLAHLDGHLIALNAMKRLNIKSREEKDRNCLDKVPYSFRPKDEFKWVIRSQEGLDEMKKYFECARPYYEMGITHLFDELSLNKRVHKKVSELIKN
jgi:hypothetical protein